MKAAVIVFPGSNCDRDVGRGAGARSTGQAPADGLARGQRAAEVDLIVVPGRLLLRRLSALRRDGRALADHARGRQRGPTRRRAGARHLQRLPDPDRGRAAARRADAQRRICISSAATSTLRVENTRPRVHRGLPRRPDDPHADRPPRRQLLRRCRHAGAPGRQRAGSPSATATPAGDIDRRANPNGSQHNIAGILNDRRNVLGLMPHPERVTDPRWAAPTGAACSTAWWRRWRHECGNGYGIGSDVINRRKRATRPVRLAFKRGRARDALGAA